MATPTDKAALEADDGPYSYDGVDEKFVRKAEKELNEKPAQVAAHIASLRRWLKSMPHLACRSDDRFLLRFLRTAKFDQSRAQMLLDNYVTIRKSPKGTPSWFEYPALDNREVQLYLENPMQVFLGHTSEGEGVYVSTMGNWNPDAIPFEQMVRCLYMSMDAVQMDQYSQINGVKVLVNLQQTDRRQLNFIENRKNFFSLMRNWQDAFPLRIRAIIYVNEPAYTDIIFTLIKNAPFLKEKFKRKLHRVGKDYDRLKKILGPQDADRLLPKEFGGSNGTLEERAEWARQQFKSAGLQREWRLVKESMAVDESKRLPNTRDYLRTEDSAADPTTGIQGTFTKLNVD